MQIDPELLAFATPRQREILEAVNECGSARAAAATLGLHHSYPSKTLKAVEAKAALQGYSPAHDMTRTVPEGFSVRGVSTYYDSEGKARGQWVKSRADDEAREAARQAAYDALAAELPRAEPVQCQATVDRLCTVYTLTDAHIGMLAWHREGGADWDLSIAERTICGCFDQAIEGAPASAVAILNQLGDLLHYDGLLPVTPTSSHVLDADGRFTKMVEVAVRVLRYVINSLLEKHLKVHLVLAEGNHDMASSVWLRTMFKALYENEPRITVDDSALPYYRYRHGKTLLAFHHSHLTKNAQLPLLVATQFAEDWGLTKHRYIHTGNLHHADEKEHSGAIVFQHPTLAARDAYAARGGWHASRAMNAITYDLDHGEVGRVTIRPEMMEA